MSGRGTASLMTDAYCLLKIPGLTLDRKYLVVNEKIPSLPLVAIKISITSR